MTGSNVLKSLPIAFEYETECPLFRAQVFSPQFKMNDPF